ncbi:MAG: hypothetical protein J5I94_29120 [Phaeodactylibacter sp.]|nr:hypothetical protein [Phaeodactylibacter sp.]
MAQTATQQNSSVKWNALLDAIEREKCILCIGPGIFTDKKGQKLEEQIISYLKKNGELDEDITCYPDGLFYFKRDAKRNNILADISRFYQQKFPEVEKIFRQMAHIPFNLILFLTPDNKYAQIAELEELPVNSDFYFKKQPPRIKGRPTREHPVAYNLFGSFDDDESIILTYDDLFDFMQSTFEGNSMSDEMRLLIKNARHFICLGLPFDKWYMQLLLRILEMHSNKRLTKYASNAIQHDQETLTFYQDQFDITFVPKDIAAFINELHQECRQGGLIRKKAAGQVSAKDEIRQLIASNKLARAMDKLEGHLTAAGGRAEELKDKLAHLRRRLRMNQEDRDKGLIDEKDYQMVMNRITQMLLNFVNEVL